MENNKGQTIFLSVIGIATLLVAIVGATFAWFSANVQGEGNQMSVTTAYLGTITFHDGAAFALSNWYPGDTTSKTFTIAADDDATVAVGYEIRFKDVTNNFTDPTDLVYSLAPDVAGTTAGGNGDAPIAATGNTQAPATGTTPVIGTGVLGVGAVHSYTLTLLFIEQSINQNDNQGDDFTATLEVNATEKYTAGGSLYTLPDLTP